jgi:hypothetical protein
LVRPSPSGDVAHASGSSPQSGFRERNTIMSHRTSTSFYARNLHSGAIKQSIELDQRVDADRKMTPIGVVETPSGH